MKESTTIYKASQALLNDDCLKKIIGLILIKSGNSATELTEDVAVEVSAYGLIVAFTWDYVTIINEKTNEVVHTTSNKEDVKEFIYNYLKRG